MTRENVMTNLPGAIIALGSIIGHALPRPGEVITYAPDPWQMAILKNCPGVPRELQCVHERLADACLECDVDMEGKE